jgi:hypothetical protein
MNIKTMKVNVLCETGFSIARVKEGRAALLDFDDLR